ncbi:MAG: 50S ribosomal protein L6 [Parachlamydiaceae bacterium]|nr:50S ribosomal protein L6 [Parachlamydiaceae bacterium]
MSRKGKLPIAIPKGVDVKVSGSEITVKGPKGTLQQKMHPAISAKIENDEVHVIVIDESQDVGNFHGLYRALINNMIDGTTQGFEKRLEMVGVGYRAAVQGHALDLQLGFSHPTKIQIPGTIQVTVDKGTAILVKGMNRQEVGQFAATVRSKRPPEPYQGKGIRYAGEFVRKKAGKTAATKK